MCITAGVVEYDCRVIGPSRYPYYTMGVVKSLGCGLFYNTSYSEREIACTLVYVPAFAVAR